jgi:hypothetical protein
MSRAFASPSWKRPPPPREESTNSFFASSRCLRLCSSNPRAHVLSVPFEPRDLELLRHRHAGERLDLIQVSDRQLGRAIVVRRERELGGVVQQVVQRLVELDAIAERRGPARNFHPARERDLLVGAALRGIDRHVRRVPHREHSPLPDPRFRVLDDQEVSARVQPRGEVEAAAEEPEQDERDQDPPDAQSAWFRCRRFFVAFARHT